MKLIFSIIAAFSKMQYKFENRKVLELREKFVIAVINPLVYYLIIEVSYIKLLLITKLIFINIKLIVPRKISYTYNS